ncbi:Uncharacterised protein [Mycobacteroides abscessus subsp. abscessus]|nr:Uncharacterised protein [Mycobacteroides abscessus subsp. abscessus]
MRIAVRMRRAVSTNSLVPAHCAPTRRRSIRSTSKPSAVVSRCSGSRGSWQRRNAGSQARSRGCSTAVAQHTSPPSACPTSTASVWPSARINPATSPASVQPS